MQSITCTHCRVVYPEHLPQCPDCNRAPAALSAVHDAEQYSYPIEFRSPTEGSVRALLSGCSKDTIAGDIEHFLCQRTMPTLYANVIGGKKR